MTMPTSHDIANDFLEIYTGKIVTDVQHMFRVTNVEHVEYEFETVR